MLVAVTSVLTVASPASAGRPFRRSRQGVCRTHDVCHVDERVHRRRRKRPVVRLEHRLLLGATRRQHRPIVQLHKRLPTARLRIPQPASPDGDTDPGTGTAPAASESTSSSCRHEGALLVAPWYDEPTCFSWAATFYAASGGRRAVVETRVTTRVVLGRRRPGPLAATGATSAPLRPRSSRRRARRRTSDALESSTGQISSRKCRRRGSSTSGTHMIRSTSSCAGRRSGCAPTGRRRAR